MTTRPWTRLGILAIAGHLGYEMAAGVAVPLSPHLGVGGASVVLGAPLAAAYAPAARLTSPHGDRRFAVLNGFFVAAVLAHYSSWPRAWRKGVPWLTECEGLAGRAIVPYNAILQISAVAAVGGMIENRSRWRWGLATALFLSPVLRQATPWEYARLREQAARRPSWWNRRLAPGS